MRLVRESKAFQRARMLSRDDPERKALFAKARAQHGCSEYALHAYAKEFGHSWLGAHLDSLTIQTLASRAYGAANRLLAGAGPPGPAHRAAAARQGGGQDQHQRPPLVRDPGQWRGLELEARLDPHDPMQAHGLSCPVKYIRLVRRKLGERNRFYAQLVCQGTPYRKLQHQLGTGLLGWTWDRALSRWSSQEATCSSHSVPKWLLTPKPCAGWTGIWTGSAGPTTRPTTTSGAGSSGAESAGRCPSARGRCKSGGARCYRKLAATRKRSHGQLAHRVLALGNAFHLEQLSYRAWQKTYGKSVQLCAPGMFVERLSRLAVSAGGTIVPINAWRARLSQTCQCGRVKKKARSERWHACPCGTSAQRDLFSAYLARFVDPETSLQGAGSGAGSLAGVGAHPCRRRTSRPSRTNPACGRRLPAAFGRPPADPSREWVGGSKGRQSILSSAEV